MRLKDGYLFKSITEIIIFLLIYLYLFSYFTPKYLFSLTTTTGGDTPSHFMAADYFIREILPKMRLCGWFQGNYAGMPLFQFYFPLPFLIMAVLNIFIPLQIAFKIVNVLGIFLLPLCSYLCLNLLGYRFPIPIYGALGSLYFLFMEANTMWGGNIPSTLSGEFCYSIGFSLFILSVGLIYKAIRVRKGLITCVFLSSSILSSHGYAFIISLFASLYFVLFEKRFIENTLFLSFNYIITSLLLSIWLLPLIYYLPWTTPFNFIWIMEGLSDVFPPILIPYMLFSAVAILKFFKDRGSKEPQIPYLLFIILISVLFYRIAYPLGMVDIRFIPPLQYAFILLGAIGLGELTCHLKSEYILVYAVAIGSILFVDSQVDYIPRWIRWDFTGFENKNMWKSFKEINNYIRGDLSDPRVIYEHHLKNRGIGSVRAFEMLPFFSGRSTLEGLYIQSSISSPFVFYLQSEISDTPSCPLSLYNYSRLSPESAIRHLRLFNVSEIITVTDKVRKAFEESKRFIKEIDIGPYSIYKVKEDLNGYVEVLRYEPVLLITDNWKDRSFKWFRFKGKEPLLVFKDHLDNIDKERFNQIFYEDIPEHIRPIPIAIPDSKNKRIDCTIYPQKIVIHTPYIGLPHLLKISYHPRWKIRGADRIYLVSPCLMLFYPQSEHLELQFGYNVVDLLGYGLSTITLISILVFRRRIDRLYEIICGWLSKYEHFQNRLRYVSIFIFTFLAFISLFILPHEDPTTIYNKGLKYFDRAEYERAKVYFEKGLKRFPLSPIVDQTYFHLGLCYFKEERYNEAKAIFYNFLKSYPETRKYSETLYHIGICALKTHKKEEAKEVFKRIIKEFPEDRWARYSKDRLKEMGS